MTAPTPFAEAVRLPAITHEMIDVHDRYDHAVANLAHTLLDQRDTSRAVAVTLEEQVHLLRVALASAAAMLDQIDGEGFWTDTELRSSRAAITRALAVTE